MPRKLTIAERHPAQSFVAASTIVTVLVSIVSGAGMGFAFLFAAASHETVPWWKGRSVAEEAALMRESAR